MSAGLRARWIAWRNARLMDPRFQRRAAAIPLVRTLANARAQRLFDVVAGFVYAQVLAACVTLDVFDRLARGPLTAGELAVETTLPEDGARRLLDAAVALELAERIDHRRYALGAQGAALLGASGLSQMIAHHALLYRDLADPVALLRAGRGEALAAYWPYASASEPASVSSQSVSAYSALMAATQPAVAADILASYPMRGHRKVMDVGGGEGAFLAAAGDRWPHLALRLFDLPAVGERARGRLAPFSGRVEIMGGDFMAGPLPGGADLVTLVRILHDHDDAGVARLLANVRAALPPGGRVLVAEPMAAEDGRDRVGAAYFGFYLLAMGQGRARAPSTYRTALLQAGFRSVRTVRTGVPALLRALVATV